MRIATLSLLCLLVASLATGCVVNTRSAPSENVEVAEPVVDDPAVEVVVVEPAPRYREYIYEPGYPPGCYFYEGYYWYGRYRYPHDVFLHRYVAENIRLNRYHDAAENRRMGQRIEQQHARSFAQRYPAGSTPPTPSAHSRVDTPGSKERLAPPSAKPEPVPNPAPKPSASVFKVTYTLTTTPKATKKNPKPQAQTATRTESVSAANENDARNQIQRKYPNAQINSVSH